MTCKPSQEASISDKVCIAAPCQFGWENMIGNDATRFCGGCNLQVYNTSVISSAEVQNILNMDADQVCLRIYRKADGTIITDECPRWLRPLRSGWRHIAKIAVAVVAIATSTQGVLARDNEDCSSDVVSKVNESKSLDLSKSETPAIVDGRHYTSGRGERHPKGFAFSSYSDWPEALSYLGLSKEDLPALKDNETVLGLLEKFPTGFKMHHQTKVPGKPGMVD